jgi:3-dehydroquinate synthase
MFIESTNSQLSVSQRLQKPVGMETSNSETYQWSVKAQFVSSYTVTECFDLFNPENQDLLSYRIQDGNRSLRCSIIIDEQVDSLYGEDIRRYFQYHQVEYRLLSLPVSEQDKTMDAVFKVVREWNDFGIARRHEPVIAIGGGVLLDIVGLTASLYRRGIPYIRVPTTLMGLIDAGIGVKTGANFQMHKNRLGTYYPPLTAFIDRSFLQTLDSRHICNGMAEIIKIAMMKDRKLFELLENHGTSLIATKFQAPENVAVLVMRRAIQGMLEELAPNLWEHKLERLVDFGHSFSPVIEMKALPKILHGEAVALDIAFSTVLAYQRGLLSREDQVRVFNVMKLLRLPLTHPLCEAPLMYKALQDTVKHRDGLQRLPLPTGIGAARFFNDVTYQEIEKAVDALKQLANEQLSTSTRLNTIHGDVA